MRRLDNEPLLDEILAHLHAYSERLFFMIGGDPDGPTELIVTAEGNTSAFGAVRALVDGAPNLSGWKFIAFKPAGGFDFVCTWEGARIDVEHAWFVPLLSNTKPSRFGVRVTCDDYVETLHDEYVAAAVVTLIYAHAARLVDEFELGDGVRAKTDAATNSIVLVGSEPLLSKAWREVGKRDCLAAPWEERR